jgi:hypothetical protein
VIRQDDDDDDDLDDATIQSVDDSEDQTVQ